MICLRKFRHTFDVLHIVYVSCVADPGHVAIKGKSRLCLCRETRGVSLSNYTSFQVEKA